jgi:DNA polymerase/3'-5' exonuclease PolX
VKLEFQEYRIWAYREAAWTVAEHPHSTARPYRTHGEEGLQALPGIGKSFAARIACWLDEDDAEMEKTE